MPAFLIKLLNEKCVRYIPIPVRLNIVVDLTKLRFNSQIRDQTEHLEFDPCSRRPNTVSIKHTSVNSNMNLSPNWLVMGRPQNIRELFQTFNRILKPTKYRITYSLIQNSYWIYRTSSTRQYIISKSTCLVVCWTLAFRDSNIARVKLVPGTHFAVYLGH